MQLFVGGNQLSRLEPVAPLHQLTLLELSNNAFSDLSPLAELSALVTLFAAGNQLSDVTPLLSLPALQGAVLERNPLDCTSESFLTLRMRLTSLTSDCDAGSPDAGAVDPGAASHRVIVVSPSAEHIRFGVRVEEVGSPPRATVVAASGPDDAPIESLAGYTVRIAR